MIMQPCVDGLGLDLYGLILNVPNNFAHWVNNSAQGKLNYKTILAERTKIRYNLTKVHLTSYVKSVFSTTMSVSCIRFLFAFVNILFSLMNKYGVLKSF